MTMSTHKVRYGVEPGQVYVSASGATYGHYVLEVRDYSGFTSEATTVTFSKNGCDQREAVMDCFKLAVVRYYLADPLPEWVPECIRRRVQK